MKWLERLIYFLLGFTICFFLLLFPNMTFKYEFDVADIFNLIITLLAALYIGAIVATKSTNVRVEKDIVISQAREIVSLIKQARQCFLKCYEEEAVSEEDRRSIISVMRNIANETRFLEEELEACKLKIGKEKINKARNHYSTLRYVLTGGNFPSQPYSHRDRNLMEEVYKSMHTDLNQLIIEVNRA